MKRTHRLGLLAIILLACSPWPSFIFPAPLPEDDRLGDVILQTSPFTTVNATLYQGAEIWIALDQRAGLTPELEPSDAVAEVRVYDSESHALKRTLPYPGGAPLSFGLSLDPEEAVAISGESAYISEGQAWTSRPLFEGFDVNRHKLLAEGPDILVAFDVISLDEILISQGDGRWSPLSLPEEAYSYTLASMAEGTLQVAWVTAFGDLCTAPYEFPSTTPTGPSFCADIGEEAFTLSLPSVNGDPGDFQVAFAPRNLPTGTHRIFHVKDGAFFRGDTVTLSKIPDAPGSRRILGELPNTGASLDVPTHQAFEGGREVDGGIGGFDFYLDCPCTRGSDPECPCHARSLQGTHRFNQGMSAITLAIFSSVDTGKTLSLRALSLPLPGSPLASSTCSEACDEETQTPSAEGDLSVTLQGIIEMAEPEDVTGLNIEIRSTTGGADGVVIQGAPELIAEVAPGDAYEVHYTHPAYAPRSVEAITGLPNTTLYVNTVFMSQGLNLGSYGIFESGADLTLPLAIAPGAGAMILPVDGAWVHLMRSDDPIGLRATSLASHPPPAGDSQWGFPAPLISPDGQVAVLEGFEGAQVQDLLNLSAPPRLLGQDTLPGSAIFATSAPVLGIPRPGSAPGGLGGITLLGYAASEGLELTISAEGSANALSLDGSVLCRLEGREVLAYQLPGGGQEAWGTLPDDGAATLIPSHDGSAAIALLEPGAPGGLPPDCLQARGCQAYLLRPGSEVIDLGGDVLGAASAMDSGAFILATAGEPSLLHIPEGTQTPEAITAPELGPIEGLATRPGGLVILSGGQALGLNAATATLTDLGGGWSSLSRLGDGSVALWGDCAAGLTCRVGHLPVGGEELSVEGERDGGALYGPGWDRRGEWVEEGVFELKVQSLDGPSGALIDERRASRGVPGVRLPGLFTTPAAFGAPCLPFSRFQGEGQVLYCVN